MASSPGIQVARFQWSEAEPLHSLICIPAVLIVLAAGILIGQPGWGVMAAGGAMCVGFGSFQRPIFIRYGPMLAAAFGITISTFVGAFFAANSVALCLVGVLWAFVYGLMNSQGTAASWVGAQCCVYLIISSAAPESNGRVFLGTLDQAAIRGGATLVGSLLQLGLIVFFWRFVPRIEANFTDPHFDPKKYRLDYLYSQISPRSLYFHFAVRLAVTAALAMSLYRWLDFGNGYWIAMTAMIIPKPELTLTLERTILRIAGTFLGAGVATVVAANLRPSPWVLVAAVLFYLWMTYLFVNVNFGVFSVALTGYIGFLLAINHLPESDVLRNRIIATSVGGVLALAVHALFHFYRMLRPPQVVTPE